MNIYEYINQFENKDEACMTLSEDTGHSLHTIKAWMYGYRKPRTHSWPLIIKATNGAVSLIDLYNQNNADPMPRKKYKPRVS